MVKIAVAGGSGNVATELLRVSVASGKHSITLLTRSPPSKPLPGVEYKTVDYHDLAGLTSTLQGFEVCLSFVVVSQESDITIQKNLIQACLANKIQRFAPSEWSIKSHSGVPLYAFKDIIADYLPTLPETQSGELQACLFQPSVFMDYFAHPYPLSPGLHTWTFFVDFENRRALVLDDGNQPLVLTACSDVSNVLALALEDTERPWPAVGGIRGARTTVNELIALGKKIRGGEWSIEYLKGEDIEKGVFKASWVAEMTHPLIPEGKRDEYSKLFLLTFLAGLKYGSWDVSDEWNQRFPEYKFIGLEEYLTKAWEGRP